MPSSFSRRRAILGVPVAFFLVMTIAEHSSAGTVVERTLAFINKKPILLTEVQLTRALLQVEDAAALERTIDESLMYEEASRLLSAPPLDADVESAVATLREKAGESFSNVALTRKAQMQLAIAAYIELRMRPLVRVEDAEVRRLFDEKATGSEAPDFDAVEASIRESLERRSLDRKIEEWVTSLRQRAEIRRPPPKESEDAPRPR